MSKLVKALQRPRMPLNPKLCYPAAIGRDRKNLRNSEFSWFRLFGRIEWVPPLKTKKLLKVMRRTGK